MTKTLTAALNSLVVDAESDGFTVDTDANRVHIYKTYPKGKVRLGVAVYVTETGAFFQAHRTDIDSSLTTNIPTIKLVREILELDK